MRVFLIGIISCCFVSGSASADNLTEKKLIGKWSHTTVINQKRVRGKQVMKQTIEFLSDKSYVWMVGPFKHEGTYELKSSTLFLTRKGVKLKPLSWENLTLKDGKIIHPVAENFYHEWAPIKP